MCSPSVHLQRLFKKKIISEVSFSEAVLQNYVCSLLWLVFALSECSIQR